MLPHRIHLLSHFLQNLHWLKFYQGAFSPRVFIEESRG
jgi:hypothetical protein